jgi:hypothetical protein
MLARLRKLSRCPPNGLMRDRGRLLPQPLPKDENIWAQAMSAVSYFSASLHRIEARRSWRSVEQTDGVLTCQRLHGGRDGSEWNQEHP